MARYEANADFQQDYYKRRNPGGPLGTDDEVSIICFPHIEYCTGGLVRSENEARTLYTVEKKGLFCSPKVHTLKEIRRRATRGETTFHFLSSASRGIAWPLHFKFASYAYAASSPPNAQARQPTYFSASCSTLGPHFPPSLKLLYSQVQVLRGGMAAQERSQHLQNRSNISRSRESVSHPAYKPPCALY